MHRQCEAGCPVTSILEKAFVDSAEIFINTLINIADDVSLLT